MRPRRRWPCKITGGAISDSLVWPSTSSGMVVHGRAAGFHHSMAATAVRIWAKLRSGGLVQHMSAVKS